eukprot:CAMPEP_0170484964 /NCGR_PEP_ID=MMETSP0208-20121228/4338_1 /TAXON_ID=197538 /ORGANISM="Strombidium inclinatum, Strain S3" /LENGTH=50 /DNA_ID=CAMNT_0010758465 /DNA_START=545 /DNA_END=697 /DNA_ORIENTATION=-
MIIFRKHAGLLLEGDLFDSLLLLSSDEVGHHPPLGCLVEYNDTEKDKWEQ